MPFSVVRDGGEETTQEILARNVSLEQAHAQIAAEIQSAEQNNVSFKQQGPDLWVSEVDSVRLWVAQSEEYTDTHPLGSEPEKSLDEALTDRKTSERYQPNAGTNPDDVDPWENAEVDKNNGRAS